MKTSWTIVLSLVLLIMSNKVNAQVISKIDVNEAIASGEVAIISQTPFDIGTIHDVFDGDEATLARTPSINPMEIILQFSNPTILSHSKLMSATEGTWKVEGATSLSDLSNETGTYVLLAGTGSVIANTFDSLPCVDQDVQFVKLTHHRTVGDDYVHLIEWELHALFNVESVCLIPKSPKLTLDQQYEMKLVGEDAFGARFDIPTFTISSSNLNVSTSDHQLMGDGYGSAMITANYDGYSDSTLCEVLQDFELELAPARVVKVALVLQNPMVPSHEGELFNEVFGWDDPYDLALNLADSLSKASGYTMNYTISDVYDEPFYTLQNGTEYVDVDEFADALSLNDMAYLNANLFDYYGMLDSLNLCESSDEGLIDEVWVYSVPYGGLFESRMAGTNAFWINGPVLDQTSCNGILPVMGLNYERGVDAAMHSYGHRTEGTMAHLFGGWDYNAPVKSEWELYSSYNSVCTDSGHVGNIHFPVNAVADYDYANLNFATSFHTNWTRYPYLSQDTVSVNCSEWNCSEMGYMMWWFGHLPKYECKNKDGKLNSWWPYIIDMDNAIQESAAIDVCECFSEQAVSIEAPMNDLNAVSIFPNPSSNVIHVRFDKSINSIKIYSMSGKLMSVHNEHDINVMHLAPGAYILRVNDLFNRLFIKK